MLREGAARPDRLRAAAHRRDERRRHANSRKSSRARVHGLYARGVLRRRFRFGHPSGRHRADPQRVRAGGLRRAVRDGGTRERNRRALPLVPAALQPVSRRGRARSPLVFDRNRDRRTQADRTEDPQGESRATRGGRRRFPVRRDRRLCAGPRDGALARLEGRTDRFDCAHHGRDRHRQGAHRSRHPQAIGEGVRSVRQGQLRGDSSCAHCVRAVRPRERRIHRSLPAPPRTLRACRRRHAFSRRGRRASARDADHAASRASGA